MKIKPHKSKTVNKMPKINLKNINFKKLAPKAIAGLLCAVVFAVCVYGTVIGIKEKVEDKINQQNTTTTVPPVIKIKGNEKTFVENGIKINLTDKFEVFDDPAIDAGFVSDGIEIYIIKDMFEDYPEYKDYSEYEYAEHLIGSNKDVSVEISEIDDDVYLEYLFPSEKGIIQAYVIKVSKESDCFVLSHFITEHTNAIAYKEYIMAWAKSIEYVGVEEVTK